MKRLIDILVLLGLTAALVACGQDRPETVIHSTVRNKEAFPPVERPAPELVATQQAFIEVYSKVSPAVVNIRAARRGAAQELGPLFRQFEEFFGQFFDGQRPRPHRQEQSLGSGFIISESGYILTNEHVVKGAEQITVQLPDKRILEGTVVGADPRTDVAVLKVEAEDALPVTVLGDSDSLQVGQWALAIGNPFGLDSTLTVGVISATGRADVGLEDYEDFIQTDASINPGNSGGPLLNIHGEVVGINTAIVASGQGIGFAIPVNLARLIADQLIENGEVVRGWLGVSIQPLSPELAESFGLDRVTGALINQVLPDSPAASAGLRRGDVLLSYDGREVGGVRELQLLVASTPAGRSVDLEVLRDGRRKVLPVTVSRREGSAEFAAGAPPVASGTAFGLSVGPAPRGDGVEVKAVEPQSAAASAGVRSGDIILAVNRREVKDLNAFDEAVKQARGGKNVMLLIRRGETTLYLAFPAS